MRPLPLFTLTPRAGRAECKAGSPRLLLPHARVGCSYRCCGVLFASLRPQSSKCFFLTSLLFWWPVVQPWPTRGPWPRWAMIPYLLVADLQNTILSAEGSDQLTQQERQSARRSPLNTDRPDSACPTVLKLPILQVCAFRRSLPRDCHPARMIGEMYGPPRDCKRFEVDEGTVRVNASGELDRIPGLRLTNLPSV